MKTELEIFFAALRFFTRLPVPAWVGHSQNQLDRATRYFPLVGLIVGLIGAFATWLTALVLPLSLALVMGMAATLLTTGAFHEDGFADACDGFGGGWDKPQILAIMKDSRIGSYGAIGIGLMLLAKWNALMELDDFVLLPALVAAHGVSRFAALTLICALDYVREEGKAKPLAQRMDGRALWLPALCALLPCALLPWAAVGVALALTACVTLLAALYFKKRIGGYTGDCLGATQQIAEIAFYCGLLCDFT